ncbi:hypothetical protein LOD99_13919 [Oopsacas minuta]|uniref:Uncharacterized protein n=1 Tax=Oopsacas minuta TaxID=111878 RepID=A0AAV7KGX0_9METZ|nr:hypothetical protein LOD99_13919 [Oopsacas minuta]
MLRQLLLFTILCVTYAEIEIFPTPELKEQTWKNFRPCRKDLLITWNYANDVNRLRRFLVKNTFYDWSDTKKKGYWREEVLRVSKMKRERMLRNPVLGSANKISVCAEGKKGRVVCTRVVYVKVPSRQFGNKANPNICKERTFPIPPDLTAINIVDVQFPNLENEVHSGVTIKWTHKGKLDFTKSFLIKIRFLRNKEWIETTNKISLKSRKYLIEGLDYSIKHYVSICGDEKRKKIPEICSKEVEIQFEDKLSQARYIGPSLHPIQDPKKVPINTIGAYTTKDKITVHWRYPFKSKGLTFHVGLFSNCDYPSALKREMRVLVSPQDLSAEFRVTTMSTVCTRVCTATTNSEIESTSCSMLIPIVNEVITPPQVMSEASLISVSIMASMTKETSTYLLLSAVHGQLEVGGSLLVTCWGSHSYIGSFGGIMVRRVVQTFTHKLKSKNENSLMLNGLSPYLEYKCALDGQFKDKIIRSINDAVFKTIAGRPTSPPAPQLQGNAHITDNGKVTKEFSLYITPSNAREGKPEFYDLVALPLIMHTDTFGREIYKPEFDPSTIIPQFKDSLGKKPSSVHHQLIAKQTNAPVPFQVYRLDQLMLPINITFNTPLDPKLWKKGSKYSFLLVAYSYSSMNGSLMYSISEASLPVIIGNRYRASDSDNENTENELDPSDPMRMVGDYMDMAIGQISEEHHNMIVGTVGRLLGYILAGIFGIILLIITVLYIRLKISIRRGKGKPKRKKTVSKPTKDEITPMIRGDSDGESFYYGNANILQDTNSTESDYGLSSLANSPIHSPNDRQHVALPSKQDQNQYVEAVNPIGHSPTLSPAVHQLSQSMHKPLGGNNI